MYYPDGLIEEIRESNDIVGVVSEYVKLERKGHNYFGLCPFHHEKTPSFSVNESEQYFYCFGCGAGGNVYTFVMQLENYGFLEAVEHLASRARISLPSPEISEEEKEKLNYKQRLYEINKEAAKFFYYQLHRHHKGKYAYNYLRTRGVDEAHIKKFGLGYASVTRGNLYEHLSNKGFDIKSMEDVGLVKSNDGHNITNRFFNRVIFPIFDVHQKVIGFGGRVLGDAQPKYLNSQESIIYNKRKHLYGLNFARKSKQGYAIVVEGYMDVIALHQAGFDNAIASLGTAFTVEQAMLLKKYFKDVVLVYDSDAAGVKATQRAIPILERSGLNVKVLNVPKYKDPDEYIKNEGKEAFEKLIQQSKTGIMFEMGVLKKKYALEYPDEKVKFAEAICEKLAAIENKVEQDIYVKEVAKDMGVHESSLRQQITKIIQNTGIVNRKANTSEMKNKWDDKDGANLAQRKLITMMIKDEKIFEVIKNYVQPDDFLNDLYSKVASYVYLQYQKGLPVKPANVVSIFTEVEEQTKVSQIFNERYDFETVEQKEKALTEIVKIMKKNKIDQLSRSNSDIMQLQKLIEIKRQLQNLKISLKEA